MDINRAACNLASRVKENASLVFLISSIFIITSVSMGWLFGDVVVRYVYNGTPWFDSAFLFPGKNQFGIEHYVSRFRSLISVITIASTVIITILVVVGILLYGHRSTDAGPQKLTSYFSSKKTRFIILACYSLLLTLVYYLVIVLPGSTYISIWTNDVFIFFDGAYRLLHGQIPHRDFHTPIGSLAYALPLVGLKLQGGFAGSLESASLIVNTFILLSASRVLSSRYLLPVSIITLLFLSLIIVVPMNVGDTSENITFAMFYNRYGWAALTVLFLCYPEPRSNERNHDGRNYLDALVIALLLAFLFYIKTTYFMVGLVFLPIMAIVSRHNMRLALTSFVLLSVILCLVEYAFGITAGYIQDTMTSVHSSGVIRGDLFEPFVQNFGEYLLVGFVFSLIILTRLATAGYVIFVLYVAGSGLAILDQNAQWTHIVTLLAVLIVSHEVLIRSDDYSSGTVASTHLKSMPFVTVIFAIIIIYLATPLSGRVDALVQYTKEINKSETQYSIAALSGFKTGEQYSLLTDVLQDKDTLDLFYKIRNNPAKQRLTQGEYMETIMDGYILLNTMDINDKSVSVLDYVNPYSFLLDLKPPAGDYSFIDKNRNITKSIHIPAKTVFQSSDYIMMPKFPINHPTNKLLKEIYGQYIDSKYVRAKESDYWYVYSRRH